jgi:hypothetical protein
VVLDGLTVMVGVDTGVALCVWVTLAVPVGSWAEVMPNALAEAQLLAAGTVGLAPAVLTGALVFDLVLVGRCE